MTWLTLSHTRKCTWRFRRRRKWVLKALLGGGVCPISILGKASLRPPPGKEAMFPENISNAVSLPSISPPFPLLSSFPSPGHPTSGKIRTCLCLCIARCPRPADTLKRALNTFIKQNLQIQFLQECKKPGASFNSEDKRSWESCSFVSVIIHGAALITSIWPQKQIQVLQHFLWLTLTKRRKNIKNLNVKFINYLNPDKKHYDSSYVVELCLPVGQILKVGESILIF